MFDNYLKQVYLFLSRWDSIPEGFGKELFESHLDRLDDYVEHSMKRTPVLAKAEITSVVTGPITYSPDAIPMVGPDAEVPNMWLALGTGYGIGLAGIYLFITIYNLYVMHVH